MKKELCRCDRCEELRAKGLKQEFTPQECANINGYVRRMMARIRKRRAA